MIYVATENIVSAVKVPELGIAVDYCKFGEVAYMLAKAKKVVSWSIVKGTTVIINENGRSDIVKEAIVIVKEDGTMIGAPSGYYITIDYNGNVDSMSPSDFESKYAEVK